MNITWVNNINETCLDGENNSNLNEHEKLLLQNLVFVGIILNLGIPLYMYAKNKKLIKHLKHEIMHF